MIEDSDSVGVAFENNNGREVSGRSLDVSTDVDRGEGKGEEAAMKNRLAASFGTHEESVLKHSTNDASDNALTDHRADLNTQRPNLLDHYSLPSPSSCIRFRSERIWVHNQPRSQIILEERVTSANDRGNHGDQHANEEGANRVNITVKQSKNSSAGQYILRALYSTMAIFIAACVFIFSVGLLLFLISDLAHQATNGNAYTPFSFFGTLFSVPILVDGLTYVLVLTTGFVVDVFSGNPLLLSFGLGSVATSWASFWAFIGVPMITFIGSLMARSQHAHQNLLVSGFISVGIFFIVFAIIVCYLQVKSSLELVQELQGRRDISLVDKVKCAVMICTRSRLSGKKQDLYIYDSDAYDLKETASMTSHSHVYMSRGKFWLRMTQLSVLSCLFETLESPKRRWTTDEISGALPFLTKNSWSLEHVFCRDRSRSGITVVGGQAALTSNQVRSSTICFFLGIAIYVLLVAAGLIWFQAPAIAAVVIVALCTVYWFGKVKRGARLLKKVNDSIDHHTNIETGESMSSFDEKRGRGLVQKWECYTITRPKHCLILAFLALHGSFCFVYPFLFLCWSKNVAGTIVFIVMALMYFQQTSIDMVPLLEELGSLGKREGSVNRNDLLGMTSREEWTDKSRLYHIQSLSNYRKIWSRALGGFVWLFVAVTIAAAVGSEKNTGSTATTSSSDQLDPWMTFPSNVTFYYQEPQTMSHPMCRLDTTDTIQYLADYAFLANLAYKTESLQPLLDTWFGKNEAVYHDGAQFEFREIHPEFSLSFASYDLVSFSDSTAAVLVRGTTTYFDYVADARLWYSTALFQMFREALPFGGSGFFDPLIRFNIGVMSLLETESIKKTSYYLETSQFIEHLKDSGKYKRIVITGHSLGGGVALISGAQTHTNAVGLSAPNTVLGRETVTPKLTLDDLLEYTFNIVPERDIFPKIGDQLNVEKIKCRAEAKDSFSCHAAARSLCEMMYSCGTVARPVFCECVTEWGYPKPVEIGDDINDFASVCLGAFK